MILPPQGPASPSIRLLKAAGALLAISSATLAVPANAAEKLSPLIIKEELVEDLKSVFATVRSKDRIEARVRTPGTVVSLRVDEGAEVKAGQVVAIVADPKIALAMAGLDARIGGLGSRAAAARLDYERATQLLKRGVTAQARVDQLKATLDLAENDLRSAQADRRVAEQQTSEGQVLAPADGRVLRVPFTIGSVVMAGESMATIAANAYLLRLELPERHARFIKKGDAVKVGARGLGQSQKVIGEGHIVQVYPELQSGRVMADAEVPGLGDYFVGERALVWISAGKRRAMILPSSYLFTRFGLDYARVLSPSGEASDVVVQPGRHVPLENGSDGREILSGLKSGDQIAMPANAP